MWSKLCGRSYLGYFAKGGNLNFPLWESCTSLEMNWITWVRARPDPPTSYIVPLDKPTGLLPHIHHYHAFVFRCFESYKSVVVFFLGGGGGGGW